MKVRLPILLMSIVLITCFLLACNRNQHIEKPSVNNPITQNGIQSNHANNSTQTKIKPLPKLVTADDLKHIEIAGDISSDDAQSLRRALQYLPEWAAEISECLNEKSNSSALKPNNLSDSECSAVAELLQDRRVYIAQAPIINEHNSFHGKILTIRISDGREEQKVWVFGNANRGWQIVQSWGRRQEGLIY